MNILYISSACSEKTLKETSQKYMKGKAIKAPQQTFDLSVALGMSKYANVDLLTLPPIPSFPSSHCLFFLKKEERLTDDLKNEFIPLFNLPVIKSINIFLMCLYKIIIWNKNTKGKGLILLHWPFYPTMLAAYISKIFSNTRIVIIVPDLPEFSLTYSEDQKLRKKISNLANKIKPNILSKFDGYVLLTKYMKQKINFEKKPYIVMEGLIREESILTGNTLEQKHPKKVVMYAGAVYRKFGLEKLVRAFNKHVKQESELWVFGTGDYVEEVINYSKSDSRIIYKGVKFRDEILEAEKKATLLINPRPTDEEFTKYSFPSKTLEYMASGTPLVSTKLKGIPDEYNPHVLWLKEETVEGIGKQLEEILSKERLWLHKKGIQSQEWVKLNKNFDVQTNKIIELLEEVLYSK